MVGLRAVDLKYERDFGELSWIRLVVTCVMCVLLFGALCLVEGLHFSPGGVLSVVVHTSATSYATTLDLTSGCALC